MSVNEQPLIAPSRIPPIRIVLADDSDVVRRVLCNFLKEEPLIEIVAVVSNFTELLEKVSALKPNVVLMDLYMRDGREFNPDFVKSQIRDSAEHVLAMCLFNDGEAIDLANSYGASLLLDKSTLCTHLIPALEKLYTQSFLCSPSVAQIGLAGRSFDT